MYISIWLIKSLICAYRLRSQWHQQQQSLKRVFLSSCVCVQKEHKNKKKQANTFGEI